MTIKLYPLKAIALLLILFLFASCAESPSGLVLERAVLSGNIEKLKIITAKNPELLRYKTVDEETPLHLAVKAGNPEVLDFFINRGLSCDAMDKTGKTPLWLALEQRSTMIIPSLIRCASDINKKLPFGNSYITYLILAVMNEDFETAKLLIDKGSEVNSGTRGNMTPLFYAVLKQNSTIAELLLNSGADINILNQSLETPLNVSIKIQSIAMITLLLEKGAELQVQGADLVESAPYYAVRTKNREILQMMLEAGATREQLSMGLFYAVSENDVDLVRWLIDHGADPLIKGPDNERAVDMSTDPEVIELINSYLK